MVPPGTTISGSATYQEAMRQCIEGALARCGGRIYGPGGAAALLGLKPTTLQSKMAKLDVGRGPSARPGKPAPRRPA
jgi:transcriptional regulator with GAF, ATPase, and Fis domain